MNYNFTSKKAYTNFLSKLKEGVTGNEAIIYFDDANGKAIKVFSFNDPNLSARKKEKKIRELIKLKKYFPNVALPEDIIISKNKCMGYTMKKLDGCTSLDEFQVMSRNGKLDLKYLLRIACKLAQLIEDLHKVGIIIGDFHPGQFMVKGEELYAVDTDTWGFQNKGVDYLADGVGRPEYIDPKVRDFQKKGIVIKKYSQESDYFSLAVVIFEMLVGCNPFTGKYSIVKSYKPHLRALNQISIIGNHNFKVSNDFQIKHVAWMSKELQNAFLQIFEKGKRFNLLRFLKIQESQLRTCKKHMYYSSRYTSCPMCNDSQNYDALKEFRTYGVIGKSYSKAELIEKPQEVRKVINDSTYFDFSNNAFTLKPDGKWKKHNINLRTEEVYFLNNGITVKISCISKIKQLFKVLFGKYKNIYGKCTFFDRLKKCMGSDDNMCSVDIYSSGGNKLFSDFILKKSSSFEIAGNYLSYIKEGKRLVRIQVMLNHCVEKELYFIGREGIKYSINESGDYCICTIDTELNLKISVNGVVCKELPKQYPKVIKYDNIREQWCIITKTEKGYNTFVIANNKIKQEFKAFSYEGLNISNSIFYNNMLVIPDDKKILFLKSGSTVNESKVTEKNIGIISKNSKISIKEQNGSTYLYVQNENQIYKFNL